MQQEFLEKTVSVVIPTYKGGEAVFETLKALGEQTAWEAIKEILLISDAPNGIPVDDAAEIAKKAKEVLGEKLKHIQQNARGQAKAFNYGIENTQGDFILFLGQDMVPDKNLVREHLAFHSQYNTNGNIAVIGYTPWHPKVKVTPFLNFANECGLQFGFSRISNPFDVPFQFAYTTNISFQKKFLRDSGELFDTDLDYYWVDSEHAHRLGRKGLKLIYNPAAIAYHLDQKSFSKFCKRNEEAGYYAVIFYRKNRELRDFLGIDSEPPLSLLRKIRIFILKIICCLLDKYSKKTYEKLYAEVLSYYHDKGVRRYYLEHPVDAWKEKKYL